MIKAGAIIAALIIIIAVNNNSTAQLISSGVADMKWSPDGESLAIADWNGTVYVLDHTGDLIFRLQGHALNAFAVAWSPDGQILATGGFQERFINLWNRTTGELIRQVFFPPDALHDGVFDLAWSSDGNYLLAMAFDTFLFWETENWGALAPSRLGSLFDAEWSPDGSSLAVTDIYYLSFFDGQTLFRSNLENDVIEIEGENPRKLSWSSNGQLLATTDRLDPRISVWDVPTRTRLSVLNTTGALFRDVVFIGDQHIAGLTQTGTIYLLDTNATVLSTLDSGIDEARILALNAQTGTLAIGGAYTVIDENGITGLPLISLDVLFGLPPV